MAQLYSNENFPLPVVEELRRLGHDVLTTHEAGEAGKSVPDEQVLAFATARPGHSHPLTVNILSTCTMRILIKLASSSVALIQISGSRLIASTMQLGRNLIFQANSSVSIVPSCNVRTPNSNYHLSFNSGRTPSIYGLPIPSAFCL